jgi:hypothetical protein
MKKYRSNNMRKGRNKKLIPRLDSSKFLGISYRYERYPEI